MTTPVVTLPMYDFAEVQWATETLLAALSEELTRAGWPVQVSREQFANHTALVAHWTSPEMALSQSCGLPYLEALVGKAQVVGTFLWDGVSDATGRYRSRIIVRRDDPREVGDLAGSIPVINNPESLSGWCSLGAALAEAGYSATDFAPVVVSGAHIASLTTISEGRADVAAIDAATFSILSRHRPRAASEVRVIGECPLIPATPLITSVVSPIPIDQLRSAIAASLSRAEAHTACEALGICGFAEFDHSDMLPIALLEQRASSVLPRNRAERK